jgi:hypothetical protein
MIFTRGISHCLVGLGGYNPHSKGVGRKANTIIYAYLPIEHYF